MNRRFLLWKGFYFFSVLVLAAVVSHGLSADNEVASREPLVLQFFKIFHSLLPRSQSSDFSALLRLKDDYVASYKPSASRFPWPLTLMMSPHTYKPVCPRGYDPDSLPYFKIFPEYIATLAPGSETDILSSHSCWGSAKVRPGWIFCQFRRLTGFEKLLFWTIFFFILSFFFYAF